MRELLVQETTGIRAFLEPSSSDKKKEPNEWTTLNLSKDRQYLNCSFKVHVGSLIRSLCVWIKMHLKIDAICMFSCGGNKLQFPGHFIVFLNMFLSLKVRKQQKLFDNVE